MMVNDIDATLAALAEPTRRRIVELLRERPRRAGELAAATGMSGPALSKHLRVLRSNGLIEVAGEGDERDARVRVYRLHPAPFDALQAWLETVQAYWDEQLGAFKAHVEQRVEQHVEQRVEKMERGEGPDVGGSSKQKGAER